MGESMKGKIKFFDKKKGYGFIDRGGNKDLYFNKNNLKQDGVIPQEDELCFYIKDYDQYKKKEYANDVQIIKPVIPKQSYLLIKNDELDNNNCLKNEDFQNFNLLLNKFALFNGEKFFFYFKNKKGCEYKINTDLSYFDFEGYAQKYYDKLEKLDFKIKKSTFKPDWRLIVGLGNPSVYETSITLHHIYGIPYIPGSAIKGVVRAYFIQMEFEKTKCKWEEIDIFEKVLETLDIEKDKILEYEDKEKGNKKIKGFKSRFFTKDTKDLENLYDFFYKESRLKEEIEALILKFRTIFGTQSQQGKVIFFDAFPKTEPKLEIDVMNPHYADYYSGKTPPADYLNPVPIYFLTVANTEFEFIIGTKKEGKDRLDETMKLLKQALREHGIGAKTAVGYGYMRN